MTMPLVLIAIGGAAGAVSRYLVDAFVTERFGAGFPLGTLLVNLSGSFVLGLLVAVAIEKGRLPADIRYPAFIGFLGAYTTFSSLTLESWRLIEAGSVVTGLGYLVGSVALGMVVVVAGLAVGRALA